MTIDVTKDTYDEAVSEGIVIVDYWANFCSPCHVLSPILAGLTNVKVVKVDIEKERELAIEYSVRSIPTMLFYKDGEIVDRRVGVLSKKEIEDILADL